MSSAERVLLVIPAFNEGPSVGDVVQAGRGLGYDVCVVDDGSVDDTAARAAAAGAHVLHLPVNLGIGGALRCGFRWALENGYATVVQVDADGQHDPAQVGVLLGVMSESEADMVVGSRFAAGAGEYPVGIARRLAMRVLSARVRRVAGVRVLDSSSGFRAIRRPLLDRFAADYPVEYLDSVEALIEAGRAGARIIEHPITMTVRSHGRGSAGAMASLWYVVRVLVAIELQHKRRNVPSQVMPSDRGALG
jgi:glycosyltransferase involved in cell wall biosynthesis